MGDADVAATVRVEWPSGITQEFLQVKANQVLKINEPPKLRAPRITTGEFRFEIEARRGSTYSIEASDDAILWMQLAATTSSNRQTTFADLMHSARRYYRARQSAE
jgi:ASPIC and UnbV